jgi:DNA-binding Lrp family transcriptional regulator
MDKLNKCIPQERIQMKFEEILDLDDLDKKIIGVLQNHPDLNNQEIATEIHLNPVVVESRVLKLKRRNILSEKFGVDFDRSEIRLAQIELEVRNVNEMWNRLEKCPYISNCFKTTGESNMIVEIFAPSSRSVDNFVDFCLRKDKNVDSIKTKFILSSMRRYPSHINFDFEKFESGNFKNDCWCYSPHVKKR